MRKLLLICIVALLVLSFGGLVKELSAKKERTEGIPETDLFETELNNLLKEANLNNFKDSVTGKINSGKLNNFKDPVTKKIEELKKEGYADREITEILKRYGMGWYPETGATWIGWAPSEAWRLPPLFHLSYREPFLPLTYGYQANQVMQTEKYIYSGFYTEMKAGSCAAKQGETTDHVITTHTGKEGTWAEAGVYKNWNNPTLWIFSYDNDEGGWIFHGATSPTTYNKYCIYVTQEPHKKGYRYDIYINNEWKRKGHLNYQLGDVNHANEVWSDTGIWTPDTAEAIHRNSRLIDGNGNEIWWNEWILTKWWHAPDPCPVKEHHEREGSSWKYETWIE
jgi:hypothetical protein